jgi:hypothetical protein
MAGLDCIALVLNAARISSVAASGQKFGPAELKGYNGLFFGWNAYSSKPGGGFDDIIVMSDAICAQ